MKRKDVYKTLVVVFGILFIVWGLAQYSTYHGENNTSGYGSTPWQGATPGSVCYVHVKADKDVNVRIFSTADMRTETKEVMHTSYGGLFDSSYETTSAWGVYINGSDYGTWVPITNLTLSTTPSTYTTYETKQTPVAEKIDRDVTLITITGKTTTFYVDVDNPDENSDESIRYTLDMVTWAPNYLLILIGIVFILSGLVYSWIKSEPVIPKIKKYYPPHKIEKKVETPLLKTFYIPISKLKDKQDLIK